MEMGTNLSTALLELSEAKTEQKLWKKLKTKVVGEGMTDYWRTYANFFPENLHSFKSRNDAVEGYDCIFRHFLARLRQKSKCCRKILELPTYFVLRLMEHRNRELAMFGQQCSF